jgi:hypothetical protein
LLVLRRPAARIDVLLLNLNRYPPARNLRGGSSAVFLLLEHQAGLFQTGKDIGVEELRSNVVMLAKLAMLMKIPVITRRPSPTVQTGRSCSALRRG